MTLAVIPARGGSKRIPRKNIKEFGGRPIIAWSINAALESECFERVIVSTDDPEIAETARRYGAEAPFVRPSSLADDFTGTIPVVAHAIDWCQGNWRHVDRVCCIYATAPFLDPADLRAGLKQLTTPDTDYAISVTSYAFPIQRSLRINPDGYIEMNDPAQFGTRSQDLEPTWHDAGQFYWGLASAWCQHRPLFGPRTLPVRLPRRRVQDIDSPEDWELAELMFNASQMR